LIQQVKSLLLDRMKRFQESKWKVNSPDILLSNPMVRTKFVAGIAARNSSAPKNALLYACAATELMHYTSLFHDGEFFHEGKEALRGIKFNPGFNTLILIGDICFCEALDLLQKAKEPRMIQIFIQKVREVCIEQIQQDVNYLNHTLDLNQFAKISRKKTGPLFAFLGICAATDEKMKTALEEAGYLIGTAFQIASQMRNIEPVGQTGNHLQLQERLKNKFEVQLCDNEEQNLQSEITLLLNKARDHVLQWPEIQKGLDEFIDEEILCK